MRKANKKVLFADIGGVCCDNPYRTMSEIMKGRLGISPDRTFASMTRGAVDLDIGRVDFRQFYQRIVSELGVPLGFQEFEAMHYDALRLKEDVCTLLRDVSRKNGLRLIALSNMPEYTWNILQRKYSLADMFDDAVLSYEYSVVKPDPSFFDVALKKANVEPSRAMFVDDRRENVEEAGRRGIQSILFTDCDGLRKEFSMNGLLGYP